MQYYIGFENLFQLTLVAHKSCNVSMALRMVNRPEKRETHILEDWCLWCICLVSNIYTHPTAHSLQSLCGAFLLSHSDVQVSCHLVDVGMPMYPASSKWLNRSILPTYTHTQSMFYSSTVHTLYI